MAKDKRTYVTEHTFHGVVFEAHRPADRAKNTWALSIDSVEVQRYKCKTKTQLIAILKQYAVGIDKDTFVRVCLSMGD